MIAKPSVHVLPGMALLQVLLDSLALQAGLSILAMFRVGGETGDTPAFHGVLMVICTVTVTPVGAPGAGGVTVKAAVTLGMLSTPFVVWVT